MIPTVVLKQFRSYSMPVSRLFTLGRKALWDETDREQGRPVSTSIDFRELGLSEADIPELTRLATDYELYDYEMGEGEAIPLLSLVGQPNLTDDNEYWMAVVQAWRALGQFKAKEAALPLFDMMKRYMVEDMDDFAAEELPAVIALIGIDILPQLQEALTNEVLDEYLRSLVAFVIGHIPLTYPEKRAQCIDMLLAELSAYKPHQRLLNALIVSELVSLKAVETLDVVRTAFAQNVVKLDLMGDIEAVEILFGVRTERSTPGRNWFAAEQVYDNELGAWYNDEYTDAFNDDEYIDDFDNTIGEFTVVKSEPKIGRNDPCPCGSGKKYKKCCMTGA